MPHRKSRNLYWYSTTSSIGPDPSTPQNPRSNTKPTSSLRHPRPRNQRLHQFYKKRPRLDPPNHQTRHPPSKQHSDAPLRPNRHQLRHLLALVVRRLLDRLPIRGQIREDGGAQGSYGFYGVYGRAGAVGGHVADGVDICGGEEAEGFGVGKDVAAFVKPGGGEEGGVGAAAGSVDVDVYGSGGVVGELDGGFAVVSGGGGGGDFGVVDGFDVHAFEC